MTTEKAILAGGCFWGLQDLIRKRPGVISTRVGYTGGDVPNATYRNHHGHAEAMEIIFDPEQISYRDLLEFFFQVHDPTTLNRQGNDIGTSYRSAIFYLSDAQKQTAEDTIADVNASGLWPGKVVTEVTAGRPVLGGRARAPGLPGEVPQRVHLPLRPPGLEAAAPRGQHRVLTLVRKETVRTNSMRRRRPLGAVWPRLAEAPCLGFPHSEVQKLTSSQDPSHLRPLGVTISSQT